MLFKASILERIAAGHVTLAFRCWTRPSVCSGGLLRTSAGILGIDEVTEVEESDLSETDAQNAGYPDRKALLNDLRKMPSGKIYRIGFHLAGPDPREALRERDDLDGPELMALKAQLEKLDQAGGAGPWTMRCLRLIGEREGRTAASLADELGFEKAVLKRRIRRLRELGLTESLQRGYRLSKRGQAVVAAFVPES